LNCYLKFSLFLLHLVLFASCQRATPTLDTSTPENFEKSISKMRDTLNKEDCDRFFLAIDKCITNNSGTLEELITAAAKEQEEKGKKHIISPHIVKSLSNLNGKNAKEIIDYAQSKPLNHSTVYGIPFNRELCEKAVKLIESGKIEFIDNQCKLPPELFDAALNGIIYRDPVHNWILFPQWEGKGGNIHARLYVKNGLATSDTYESSFDSKYKSISFQMNFMGKLIKKELILGEKISGNWYFVYWNLD